MSWLSKATKKVTRTVKKAAGNLWDFTKDVSDVGYNLIGATSPNQRQEATNAANAAEAHAAAEAKQAEYEASEAAGLEALSRKKKKGYAASMLASSGSSLGSGSTLGS